VCSVFLNILTICNFIRGDWSPFGGGGIRRPPPPPRTATPPNLKSL